MIRAASAFAAVLALAAADVALADSRLFSVSTDSPGVTVTAAARNGSQLSLAGGDGTVTFFRIDNPGGPVPCVSNMGFTLSSGASITGNVNFCEQDWDVVLALAPPSRPQPQPPAFGSAIITTNDPAATIVGVFVGGAAVPLQSASGPNVSIAASSLQSGAGCTRNMGVELADGRRMARQVDVCVGNGPIVVPLADTPQVAQQPTGLPAFPAFPQPGQPQQPLAPPAPVPVPQGPEVVDNMTWQSDSVGGRASLTYGVPQTGAGELTAVCETGSRAATLVLTRSPPGLASGATVSVRFEEGSFSRVYQATGTDFGAGVPYPRIDLGTDDPLWSAIIRGSVLFVTVGNDRTYGLSLRGSSAATRPFLENCNPAPVAPPAPPPQSGQFGPAPPPARQPGPVSFFCDDGQAFTAVFDNRSGIATVYWGPGAPLTLTRTSPGRFVGSGAELIGVDETITWRDQGRAPTTCRAAN